LKLSYHTNTVHYNFFVVFALVTVGGFLIIYNIYVKTRALYKTTAHDGDTPTLAWHPKHPNMLATGGTDKYVKIWNVEEYLGLDIDEANLPLNQGTWTSRADSIATESSTENDLGQLFAPQTASLNSSRTLASNALHHLARHNSGGKGNIRNILQLLSIDAQVARVRWRPLASGPLSPDDMDRHESMIAVATQPIKGPTSGGAGLLMLWSWHRPFMPLSVVGGHKDGGVVDFDWIDTPSGEGVHSWKEKRSAGKTRTTETDAVSFRTSSRIPGSKAHESEAILFDNSETDGGVDLGVWQHVLSVGRDGRCLIQSFVRGKCELGGSIRLLLSDSWN
jgi:WD40 repeat protein